LLRLAAEELCHPEPAQLEQHRVDDLPRRTMQVVQAIGDIGVLPQDRCEYVARVAERIISRRAGHPSIVAWIGPPPP
jgi:hypothetical protein